MLRVITDVFFTSFFTTQILWNLLTNLKPRWKSCIFGKFTFFEKFLICQIKCIFDKTQNPIVYYILKMGRMQASDMSMHSCSHAETLKEICSYDRAWNGLSIACILWYRQ